MINRCYHSDHLGSASFLTDRDGYETQQLVYLPFGELRSNREYLNINNKYHEQHWVDMKYNTSQYDTPYKFNGKEKDEELRSNREYNNINNKYHEQTGYNNFGARYYYDWASIWLSVDPMSDKYPHLTYYKYCANNPVMLVDPDGRIIKSVFNRETNKLYIMDLDHYKKGLPIKHVSASDYQLGGIRDKNGNLTHNQVLVINNVFSGGQVENGKIVRVSGDRKQKAIPNATYDIVDNNADTRHKGWFRLDRQDNKRYNDKDEVTDRDGYRFHLGGLSWGCVTVDKTQDEAQVSWDVVTLILNSTSTTIVSEKRGRQWLNPFSKLIRYGTMEVKGADKIPYKTKEEE